MKKTIILSAVILLTTLLNYSFGKSPVDPSKQDHVTTLIINANVTVVLVNHDNAALEMEGRGLMKEYVTIKRAGDTVIIDATKNRNFKNAGIVYVPAQELKNIRINSEAYVKSLYALNVPKLDVVINGACNIAISNVGQLNLIETEKYAFSGTTDMRPYPSSIVNKKD